MERRKRRRAPRRAPLREPQGEDLRPRELLMRVVRGEAVGGQVPTLAQRLAAAKHALPYDARRRAAKPARKGKGKAPVVELVSFFDLPGNEGEGRPEGGAPTEAGAGLLPAPSPDGAGAGDGA